MVNVGVTPTPAGVPVLVGAMAPVATVEGGTVPVGTTVSVTVVVAVAVVVGDRVGARVAVAVGVGTISDISTSTAAGKIDPT
jgi:hypothetical protein